MNSPAETLFDVKFCRKAYPPVFWYEELELPGLGRFYNLVQLGEGSRSRWFALEFPNGDMPRNRGRGLKIPRICVREEWFADEHETLPDYIRRKARECAQPRSRRRAGAGRRAAAT